MCLGSQKVPGSIPGVCNRCSSLFFCFFVASLKEVAQSLVNHNLGLEIFQKRARYQSVSLSMEDTYSVHSISIGLLVNMKSLGCGWDQLRENRGLTIAIVGIVEHS
jgi:hypothetical protein